MKKTIFQLFLMIINCTLLFANESKPVAKGFIALKTGLYNQLSNLKFEGTRVSFTKKATNSKFNYLSENEKLIEDVEENIIYDKNKSSALKTFDSRSVDTVIPKKQIQKLKFVNAYNILQNEKQLTPEAIRGVIYTNSLSLSQYNTGKTLVDIGNVALGAGIGLIVGGGLSNLNNASSTPTNAYSSGESRGTPLFIITGIVIGCISIPLKIIGRSTIKEGIEKYNEYPCVLSKAKDINLVLFAKNNRVGLNYKF